MLKFLIPLLIVVNCLPADAQEQEYARATIGTPGGELPFLLLIKNNPNGKVAEVLNGDEHIVAEKFILKADSFSIRLPVFNTLISGIVGDKNVMTGTFEDFTRTGAYILPFAATPGENYRFIKNPLPPKNNISGRYTAVFQDETASDTTVGIFTQQKNHLSGTFLTTTGDYRFLEGDVSADSFYLSAFDGSHVFLIKGKIEDDGSLTGDFWSGKHYHAHLTAVKNENAHLPDARNLTHLKPGYEKIDFSFPDENGNTISLADAQFKNKAVIVQISGTWCPNCMDETSYMHEIEEKYKGKDLAIIDLSFERQPDPENFKQSVARLRSHFGIQYTVLNAGLPKTASAALPMLDHVMGFPTTIILNKQHQVAEIYTGFNGPATGELFLQHQQEFESLLDSLLQ